MLRCIVAWLLAAAAFALANIGHLSNPGYFSHDELQWGWRAHQGLAHDWFDNTVFQYRPLTFQLWLLIGRGFFGSPVAYHAGWVALGFGVCALLYGVLRRAGAAPRIALFGAAAFALNPYAMYVHGWVATLAELLWTACALGIAWFAFDARRAPRSIALAAFVLSTLALLSKEAALAILPLALLACMLARSADDGALRWRAALVGSVLPTVVYLALRLPVLMSSPGAGGAYAWSLANMPQRWAEFQAWPLVPTLLEMTSLASASALRMACVAMLAASLLFVLLRTHRRLGLVLVAGGAIALGPAIVLAKGYPQYGYAASALAWACITCAWPRMRMPARVVVVLALVANLWHGVNVQREMLRVGRIEANFTPALRPWAATPGNSLTLDLQRPADIWIYRRLALDLPYARREVNLRETGGDLHVTANGKIVPARPGGN